MKGWRHGLYDLRWDILPSTVLLCVGLKLTLQLSLDSHLLRTVLGLRHLVRRGHLLRIPALPALHLLRMLIDLHLVLHLIWLHLGMPSRSLLWMPMPASASCHALLLRLLHGLHFPVAPRLHFPILLLLHLHLQVVSQWLISTPLRHHELLLLMTHSLLALNRDGLELLGRHVLRQATLSTSARCRGGGMLLLLLYRVLSLEHG